MVGAALISGCLIPAWILPGSMGSLSASGFMMQFFVQGAWGVSTDAFSPRKALRVLRFSPFPIAIADVIFSCRSFPSISTSSPHPPSAQHFQVSPTNSVT